MSAHVPVLQEVAIALLCPRPGGRYLDATVVLGGHAEAILRAAGPTAVLVGVDRDAEALALARQRLAACGAQVDLRTGRYVALAEVVGSDERFDGILFDLGGKERSDPKYDIDDNMSCQGSCWFMPRRWFTEHLGGLSEVGYGTFTQEFQEVGNKTWLGGGGVKVNKKTWYAHLHKGKTYGRMWHMSRADDMAVRAGHAWSAQYWMRNQWEGRVHDFEWLIEKFYPLPTWDVFGSVEEAFRQWHEHNP